MRNVLILGTGGSPGNGIVQSLKNAPEKLRIIGTEVDRFTGCRSTADKTYLTPNASSGNFEALIKIIKREKICFIHAQPEREVLNLSEHRHLLDAAGVKYLLPDHETIINCQNKFLSYNLWKQKGLRVPVTLIVNDENDLKESFRKLGPKIWLRKIKGGGGEGALPADNYDFARVWVSTHQGWGQYTAAELLSGQSTTWSSIWKEGELVIAQSRRRLSWEYGSKFLSGVSGITGIGMTVTDPELDEIAQKAILAVDPRPNGIFSVDLTEDLAGRLNITEINIGRFFTTIYFFTEAGLNMPYILFKCAMNEPLAISRKINPLPPNIYWIRGTDFLPKLVSEEDLNKIESLS